MVSTGLCGVVHRSSRKTLLSTSLTGSAGKAKGWDSRERQILKHILNEWLSIHSDDVPDELRVAEAAEIVRQAVSEFILSHHEEFLA